MKSIFFSQFDCHHYEQKIRHLEYENQELRTEVSLFNAKKSYFIILLQ
jgi:hypothetical protein